LSGRRRRQWRGDRPHVNRGGETVIPNVNRAGGPDPDVGDGFLMKRGFTVVTVGWEFDLLSADMIRIDVPVATDAGRPIVGMVRASCTPARRDPFRVGDPAIYTPIDPADPAATLTVGDTMAAAAETIPRARWTLSGTTVTVDGGFEPGRIYELSFPCRESTDRRPRVCGRWRRRELDQARTVGAHDCALCPRVRQLAERPISSDRPLPGLQ
jgi:hypothetical protein